MNNLSFFCLFCCTAKFWELFQLLCWNTISKGFQNSLCTFQNKPIFKSIIWDKCLSSPSLSVLIPFWFFYPSTCLSIWAKNYFHVYLHETKFGVVSQHLIRPLVYLELRTISYSFEKKTSLSSFTLNKDGSWKKRV